MVAKHLVPLCILISILAGAPPLGAQPLNIGDRPMEQKEEAEPVKPPGKKPMTESKVVIVNEILPDDHVKLPPDGTTVEKRRIFGTNLDRSMDVKVLKGSASTSAVTASLRATNKTDRRQLWLTAKEGAPAGTDYRVRLVAGGQTIDIPLTVEVLPKKIDAAAIPSALSTADKEEKPAIDPSSRSRLLKGTKTGQIAHPPGTLKEAPGSGGGIKVDPPSTFGVKAQGLKPPGGKEITESPGPGGSKIDPGLLEDAGLVEIPDARLHVKRSDAIEAWGPYWKDRPAMTNSFRWLTLRDDIVSWRWEVSDYPDFSSIVASGTSDTPPGKGKYSFFDIDFAPIAGGAALPPPYYVRVVPAVPAGKKGKKREDIEPSNRVNVIISEPTEVTQFTEPVITGVMPFSSCGPGGTVVLKGFQFGEDPGEILLGFNIHKDMSFETVKALMLQFETKAIPLEPLQWSPTLASAEVPMVTGVPDLQMSIRVKTADGRESNRDLTCFFRATREELALLELCDGIMIDHGGYFADADDFHFSLGIRDDPRLAVWHRSSDEQSDEDLVKLTRPLRNGWKYTRYEFAQTSSRNVAGWISEVAGFRPGSEPHNIAVRWGVDEAEIGWQMYIYAEGPAGVPLWDDRWYEPQWCHPRGY